jgi:hypothetical protein
MLNRPIEEWTMFAPHIRVCKKKDLYANIADEHRFQAAKRLIGWLKSMRPANNPLNFSQAGYPTQAGTCLGGIYSSAGSGAKQPSFKAEVYQARCHQNGVSVSRAA